MSLLTEERKKKDGGGGHVKTEAETGVMQPQAKDTWDHQKLKEPRKCLPRSFLESLDLGLPSSRVVKECSSVVFSHGVSEDW